MHRVSEEHFAELCETFRIKAQDRSSLRQWLDELVSVCNHPDIGGKHVTASMDRYAVRRCLRGLRVAEVSFKPRAISKTGESALRLSADRLASLPSLLWLQERIPDPGVFNKVNRELAQLSSGGRKLTFGYRNVIARAQHDIVERYPSEVIAGILCNTREMLEQALQILPLLQGGKGGRPRQDVRKWVIFNLARKFEELGYGLQAGPKSEFPHFCEVVFDGLGWKSQKKGLRAAIPAALKRFPKTPH
jgi:hypothetical protein